MSYNKGSNASGCIDFPEKCWKTLYDYWINRIPLRYYAYIVRASDGIFVGEVNLHKNESRDMYDDLYNMGIIIENQYRCNGYGSEAFGLLLDVAFCELGAASVQNSFESYKLDALKIHLYTGFKIHEDRHLCLASITKSEYFNNRK